MCVFIYGKLIFCIVEESIFISIVSIFMVFILKLLNSINLVNTSRIEYSGTPI